MSPTNFFKEVIKNIKNIINHLSLPPVIANRENYNSFSNAEAYSQFVGLKKAEQAILDLILKESQLERMLDIGVGGGRTTAFFSKMAKTYVGIDYSKNMIATCQRKFRNRGEFFFVVGDARNLTIFHDGSFDFVLFSHGGIDAVGHNDRIRIFEEIHRVAKKNMLFSFSTSNLNSMYGICRLKLTKNPKILVKKVIRLLLVRLLNKELWLYCRGKNSSLKHTLFNIGLGNNWGLKTYCVTATEQIRQLDSIGFNAIGVYNMKGKKVTNITNIEDFELYFLCNKKK